MYNWAVDVSKLKKNKREYAIWKLKQLVNFGLNREKLNKQELKKYWPFLDLDFNKKKYLSWLLWPEKQS